jgi:hypothetical protein
MDPTNDPDQDQDQQDEPKTLDPEGFGPEGIDGWRPPGVDSATPSDDPDPGDTELNREADEEPAD